MPKLFHLYVKSKKPTPPTPQKKKKSKLIDTQNRLVVTRGGYMMGEVSKGQKIQTSSYKICYGCTIYSMVTMFIILH